MPWSRGSRVSSGYLLFVILVPSPAKILPLPTGERDILCSCCDHETLSYAGAVAIVLNKSRLTWLLVLLASRAPPSIIEGGLQPEA